jgi:cysteine desulfuration protein SufE
MIMTIDRIQHEIIDEMSMLDDWMDKYEYLIRMSKNMNASDENLRTEQYVLQGCQARVWIKAELADNKVCFAADSDSLITRGVLALLLRVLSNQTPEDIANADLYFIAETGLSTNLSPTRANGLALIVKQMKSYGAMFVSDMA